MRPWNGKPPGLSGGFCFEGRFRRFLLGGLLFGGERKKSAKMLGCKRIYLAAASSAVLVGMMVSLIT
jgi:hypothetical protein